MKIKADFEEITHVYCVAEISTQTELSLDCTFMWHHFVPQHGA